MKGRQLVGKMVSPQFSTFSVSDSFRKEWLSVISRQLKRLLVAGTFVLTDTGTVTENC